MLRFVQSIAVIGCGGIGSWLLPPLLRFLNADSFRGEIQLWDGDRYTIGNRVRQDATQRMVGRPKAEALVERYRQEFSGLCLRNRNEYVTSDIVAEAVTERSLIFVAVDNHPARAVIARHAEQRRDVCVLSAGNEKYDGNVFVMLRKAGRPMTAHLLERHPEIAIAKRGDRAEIGCEELVARGETQLLVTNFMAAAAMLAAFHALWTHGERSGRHRTTAVPQEVFFDAGQCSMNAVPIF